MIQISHNTTQRLTSSNFSIISQSQEQLNPTHNSHSNTTPLSYRRLALGISAGLVSGILAAAPNIYRQHQFSEQLAQRLVRELARLIPLCFQACQQQRSLNFSQAMNRQMDTSSYAPLLRIYFQSEMGRQLLSLCDESLRKNWSEQDLINAFVRSQYQGIHITTLRDTFDAGLDYLSGQATPQTSQTLRHSLNCFLGNNQESPGNNFAQILLRHYRREDLSQNLRNYLESQSILAGVADSTSAAGIGSNWFGKIASTLAIRSIALLPGSGIIRFCSALICGAASSIGQVGFQLYWATQHLGSDQRLAMLSSRIWDIQSAIVVGMICGGLEFAGTAFFGKMLTNPTLEIVANFTFCNVGAELVAEEGIQQLGMRLGEVQKEEDALSPQTLYGKWLKGAAQELIGDGIGHASTHFVTGMATTIAFIPESNLAAKNPTTLNFDALQQSCSRNIQAGRIREARAAVQNSLSELKSYASALLNSDSFGSELYPEIEFSLPFIRSLLQCNNFYSKTTSLENMPQGFSPLSCEVLWDQNLIEDILNTLMLITGGNRPEYGKGKRDYDLLDFWREQLLGDLIMHPVFEKPSIAEFSFHLLGEQKYLPLLSHLLSSLNQNKESNRTCPLEGVLGREAYVKTRQASLPQKRRQSEAARINSLKNLKPWATAALDWLILKLGDTALSRAIINRMLCSPIAARYFLNQYSSSRSLTAQLIARRDDRYNDFRISKASHISVTFRTLSTVLEKGTEQEQDDLFHRVVFQECEKYIESGGYNEQIGDKIQLLLALAKKLSDTPDGILRKRFLNDLETLLHCSIDSMKKHNNSKNYRFPRVERELIENFGSIWFDTLRNEFAMPDDCHSLIEICEELKFVFLTSTLYRSWKSYEKMLEEVDLIQESLLFTKFAVQELKRGFQKSLSENREAWYPYLEHPNEIIRTAAKKLLNNHLLSCMDPLPTSIIALNENDEENPQIGANRFLGEWDFFDTIYKDRRLPNSLRLLAAEARRRILLRVERID